MESLQQGVVMRGVEKEKPGFLLKIDRKDRQKEQNLAKEQVEAAALILLKGEEQMLVAAEGWRQRVVDGAEH